MSPYSPDDNDCLLIIDVQNDFCAGGALEVNDGDAIVAYINQLATSFSCVVTTQDWHPNGHSSFASSHAGKSPFDVIKMPYGDQTLWPDHCIIGSDGAEFHTDLDLTQAQLNVRKGFRRGIDSYSAFYENDHTTSTGLAGYLRDREIDRVVCVGLAYDFCVRFSAEDARREGFNTVVLSQLCRAIDLDGSAQTASNAMQALGVEII